MVTIDDQFLVPSKMVRIFQNLKKAIEFLVVLKEIPREHVMACRHCTFVVLVCLSVSPGLRPGEAVRIVKKPDHAMHKIISPRDLPIGNLYRLIRTFRVASQLLVDRGSDQGRAFDGKENPAGKNRIDEP